MEIVEIEDAVKLSQTSHKSTLVEWKTQYQLEQNNEGHYYHKGHLVVMEDTGLRRGVTTLFHDKPTAGHPRIAKTLLAIATHYWWPKMKEFITAFIRGCTICQANKPRTTQAPVPLDPIPVKTEYPFQQVSMDLMVKLPPSMDPYGTIYDSILIITDHGCSKAAIFIPCRETNDAEAMAKHYIHNVFRHYGIPKTVISD